MLDAGGRREETEGSHLMIITPSPATINTLYFLIVTTLITPDTGGRSEAAQGMRTSIVALSPIASIPDVGHLIIIAPSPATINSLSHCHHTYT